MQIVRELLRPAVLPIEKTSKIFFDFGVQVIQLFLPNVTLLDFGLKMNIANTQEIVPYAT